MKRFKPTSSIFFILLLSSVGCVKEPEINRVVSSELNQPSKQEQLDHIIDEYRNFKLSSDVTVYDENKKFYVTYRVFSNNKEALSAMHTSLMNSVIELEEEKGETPQRDMSGVAKNPVAYNQKQLTEVEDLEKGVYLVELDKNLGNNALAQLNLATDSRVLVSTYTTVTIINHGFAYEVYDFMSQAQGLYYFFYYLDYPTRSYILDEIKSSTTAGSHFFSTGFFSYLKLVVVPTTATAGNPMEFSWTIHTTL